MFFAATRKNAEYTTQEALGRAVGVPRSTVAKWETGERYPRPPMIPKLAKVLNVTEGEIIAAITATREASKNERLHSSTNRCTEAEKTDEDNKNN